MAANISTTMSNWSSTASSNQPDSTDLASTMYEDLRAIQAGVATVFPGMAGRSFRAQSKSANYTLAATDNLTVIVCTSAITLTGTASTLGNGFSVVIQNNYTGAITLPGSFTLPSLGSVLLTSDGSNWNYFLFATGNAAPNSYVFHVDKNGSDQTISASTYTKIQFNNEVIDNKSCFDSATNYRFTPTDPATYFIKLQVQGNPESVGNALLGGIYKNGTIIAQGRQVSAAAGTNLCVEVSTVVAMNGSTDYIEGYAYIGGSTSRTIDGAVTGTFMYGFRLI